MDITYKVQGASPLLTHNPAGMGQASDSLKTKKSQIPTPEAEAAAGLYITEAGHFGLPAASFRGALVGAAKGRKFGKTFATSAVKGAVFVSDELCTILDENGDPATDYVIDARRAKVGTSGITRHRPKFTDWFTVITFDVDDDILSGDQVMDLLEIAGRSVGVGDYRPECSGWFGRFEVVEMHPA